MGARKRGKDPNRLRRSLHSMLTGATYLFDFGRRPRRMPSRVSLDEEVARAIASDWQAVGNDMRAAEDKFAPEVRAKRETLWLSTEASVGSR